MASHLISGAPGELSRISRTRRLPPDRPSRRRPGSRCGPMTSGASQLGSLSGISRAPRRTADAAVFQHDGEASRWRHGRARPRTDPRGDRAHPEAEPAVHGRELRRERHGSLRSRRRTAATITARPGRSPRRSAVSASTSRLRGAGRSGGSPLSSSSLMQATLLPREVASGYAAAGGSRLTATT